MSAFPDFPLNTLTLMPVNPTEYEPLMTTRCLGGFETVNGDGHQGFPAKKESDKEFWERHYGRPLTDAEVEEIKTNLLNLAELLIGMAESDADVDSQNESGLKDANGGIIAANDPLLQARSTDS